MPSSLRRRIVWVAVGATATSGAVFALACNQVAGLDDFQEVFCYEAPCLPDASTPDVFAEAATDAPPDVIVDAGTFVDVGPVSEHRQWAHWKMPNPDASLADGASRLPNPHSYTTQVIGVSSTPIVVDEVTKLQWLAKPPTTPVNGLGAALDYCRNQDGGWRVPTRIELVTLVDFTRSTPALDPVFSQPGFAFGRADLFRFWTLSRVSPKGDAFWTVNFNTAKVDFAEIGNSVRCVRGGPVN